MNTITATIPFYGDTLEAVCNSTGEVFVSLRRCCRCLGLDFSGQLQKLKEKSWAVVEIISTTAADGKRYQTTMIDLNTLCLWLGNIEENRVSEVVRPKLVLYQKECAKVLRNHFVPKAHTDPIVALLDSVKEVRLAQIETDRRLEAARQLATQARTEAAHAEHIAQAALDTARSNYGYYSVLGWLKLMKRTVTQQESAQHGKALSRICRKAGIQIKKICDSRWGDVNIYPKEVLIDYFGDVEELHTTNGTAGTTRT